MRDSICNDCAKRTRCDMAEIGRSPLAISTCYGYEKGNPTNAERIRAMTDEELAWELCRIVRMPFYKDGSEIDAYEVDCWAKWLKREAEI